MVNKYCIMKGYNGGSRHIHTYVISADDILNEREMPKGTLLKIVGRTSVSTVLAVPTSKGYDTSNVQYVDVRDIRILGD